MVGVVPTEYQAHQACVTKYCSFKMDGAYVYHSIFAMYLLVLHVLVKAVTHTRVHTTHECNVALNLYHTYISACLKPQVSSYKPECTWPLETAAVCKSVCMCLPAMTLRMCIN